ncbi:hypothetical protein LZ009_03545 [Ramlibacter sp. XY19]|uniref:hypothetical protein n=1 Tax=Ramlibacter paludis TaxID=2908000 RepID=UPI0023D9F7BB|nr:hypothetical protein [Ramlibacter paludis]MCG2591845.1 hypothetical protein [Ramlibacter paludis]
MFNTAMGIFRRKPTVVVRDENVYDEALREFGRHDDLPPAHIDVERFDRALAGLALDRTIIPNGLTVEQIGQFMDYISKEG